VEPAAIWPAGVALVLQSLDAWPAAITLMDRRLMWSSPEGADDARFYSKCWVGAMAKFGCQSGAKNNIGKHLLGGPQNVSYGS
jgi:hypothetical protein